MPTSLYIVSTPLNFVNALMMSMQRRAIDKSFILFIDQPEGEENNYYEALKKWNDSPFVDQWILNGKFKGLIQKYKARKNELTKLDSIVSHVCPDKIWCGNDRRIEFQYAMSQALAINPLVEGIYLEEGLFSYDKELQNRGIINYYLEYLVKKISYGQYWKQPRLIGLSGWMSQGYVYEPSKVIEELKRTLQLHALSISMDQFPEVEALIGLLFADINKYKVSYDYLVLLPNASILSTDELHEIEVIIKSLHSEGKSLLIKPHPKQGRESALQFDDESDNIQYLPSYLALEIILPFLSCKNIITGKSSTGMTAKMLRPNIPLIDFKSL